MKAILITLFLFITTISFSQKKEVKKFKFQNHEIEYTRVDYSKYGIAQFFITMYNDNYKNSLIEQKSINCLNNKVRLYHTLYFFLKIPDIIEDTELKSELFTKFIKHLKKEEKMKDFNLYLNFDVDYSISYLHNEASNVKRITTNITGNKMCKTLTIR